MERRRSVLGSLSSVSAPLSDRVSPNNMNLMPSFLTPPEEAIIRSRSRLRAASMLYAAEVKESCLMPVTQETPEKPHAVRMSPRKRLLLTPPETPSSPIKKRPRVKKSKDVPLATSLSGLTQEQLVELICKISLKHPDIEDELKELVPKPDIAPMEEKLVYLHRNIYKSFPNSRWGSSRDAFCFRRVKTHLEAFKKACIDQARSLTQSQNWESVVEYVLMALKHVYNLPDWDNPTHNAAKNQCFRQLASQCLTALKKCSCDKARFLDFKQRLEEKQELSTELDPCIAQITKILEKLK